MRISFFLAVLLTSLCGCGQNSTSPQTNHWQEIAGRDDGKSIERPLLYRASVPSHWVRRDPKVSESITDTVKANCEFFIRETEGEIRLTVHTFPFVEEEGRIPPEAQIARWKKQLEDLDLLSLQTHPESHGGFSGLYFEGEGKLQGNRKIVMGWSMRLATPFAQKLKWSKEPTDHIKRADYTIKANGPPDMIHKHRQELIQFAHSFELIDELPSPL